MAINYIDDDTDLQVGQIINVITDTVADIAVSIPGPAGFFDAPIYQFINISDFACELTPRDGEINGEASFVLAAQTSLALMPNGVDQYYFVGNFNPDISGGLVIQTGQSLTYSATSYDGTGSFQPIGPDLNLDPAAGSSTDPKYIATGMFNVIGDALTKTKTYIGALIAKLSITGTNLSSYPRAALVAEVGDGVTEADGAICAVLGGDSAVTTADAAFSVDNQNSTSGSGFDYIIKGTKATHDGYPQLVPKKGFALVTINSVSLPVGIYFGVATDDAGIVAQVGADNTIGDGSLYISLLDGSGGLFQKQNDVWEELAVVP